MEKKKNFAARMEAFFAGKGFYIVLLLCVAVIGVSAWSMLSAGGGAEELETGLPVSAVGSGEFTDTLKTQPPATVTPSPAKPTVTAKPEPEPEPEAPASVPEAQPEAPAVAAPPAEEPVEVVVLDYFIWPVTGAVEADYSMAALVYDVTMRDWRTHDGLDLAADKGAQVRAAANGTVTAVYNDERYGTTVVIEHANGLTSTYASLAETPTVAVGDRVGVGEVIGAVGDTALCEIGEASHLHFAMARNGESVDPKEYMP